MRIVQKRVRVIEKYLSGINPGMNFYIGLGELPNFINQLEGIGFGANLILGQQVLPTIIGRVTRINANGSFLIRRDLQKETLYRQAEVTDWHGNPHTVDIPYKRYPREHIPAPNIELTLRNGMNNSLLITSPLLTNNAHNAESIKHIINLFLEIFGECEVLQENLLPAFNVPVTRLNWTLLPNGNYPWQVLQNNVQGILNGLNQHRRGIIQERIERISLFIPDFVAVGNAGFKGYIVFGFPNKNFFVLESIYLGNATYILDQNWPQISQLSKEQILDQNLHQHRIIHNHEWEQEINNLLA